MTPKSLTCAICKKPMVYGDRCGLVLGWEQGVTDKGLQKKMSSTTICKKCAKKIARKAGLFIYG